jgi:hypothetical protein
MTSAAAVPPYAAPQQGVEAQPTNGCPQTPWSLVGPGRGVVSAFGRAPRVGGSRTSRPRRRSGSGMTGRSDVADATATEA